MSTATVEFVKPETQARLMKQSELIRTYATAKFPYSVTVAEIIEVGGLSATSSPSVQRRLRELREIHGYRVDSRVNSDGVCEYTVWPDGNPKHSILETAGHRRSATSVNTAKAAAWFEEQFPKFVTYAEAAAELGIHSSKIQSLASRMSSLREKKNGSRNYESTYLGGGQWAYRLHPITETSAVSQ